VARYSRLMGLDEAGTARALREHRAGADPLVATQGWRIVETTGSGEGDDILDDGVNITARLEGIADPPSPSSGHRASTVWMTSKPSNSGCPR
jgi:hypothetical protein